MTLLGAAVALVAPFSAQPAQANQHSRHANHQMSGREAARVIYAGVSHYGRHRSSFRSGFAGGTLQCVPFARENSGIELTGNAVNWWDNAAGIFERGARPEVGSILNFRGTRRMRLGHVAVVSNVLDSHTVQIDHANWSGRGVISRNVTVVDVSPANDWSAVRVALGNGEFGSVYPTYGFIYDRPDKGTMLANAGIIPGGAMSGQAVTTPALNSMSLNLRPWTGDVPIVLTPQPDDEVAEAADDVETYRTRRSGNRSHASVHYGRSAMQSARYGYAGSRGHRSGEVMLAQLSGGADRLTSGRMMGGQVLFMGNIASRGGRDIASAGKARSSGVARQAVTHRRASQLRVKAGQPGRG